MSIILKEQTIQRQLIDVGNVIDYFDFDRHFSKDFALDLPKASSVYAPLVPDKTVLIPVSTNEITVLSSHQKVNHAPTADFNYNLNIGQLTLESTSTDPDDDPLIHRWTITDDIIFRDKNVLYNFKRPGSHSIKLTVSDGEFSDSKTVTVVSTNDENTINDYIIPDFVIAQDGSDFTCTDTSETYNVYQYTREWYLDGVLQSGTSDTIEFTLYDKNRHQITLKCKSFDFERSVTKYAYADVSAIISVRSIVINRGQTIELDGSNSYAVEDLVNSYEWETVE